MNNLVGTPDELIPKMLKLDRDKKYQLSEYKEKRSKDQNSYYWELLNQLSKKTKIPPEEIHKEMIYKSCPFEEYLVPQEANLRGLEYYYIKKENISEKGHLFKLIRVYVGSHLLDTKEMSILLDNMIEECQLQGIETMTPEQLSRLREMEKKR